MKVTYIQRSSFLVELENLTLLFDYYDGVLPAIRSDQPLLIFASHSHWDHFSEKVFALSGASSDVRFFLSDDIKDAVDPGLLPGYVTFMKHDEKLALETGAISMEIRTLRSNDLGVAFVLRTKEALIYHAGDLNNWWWEGDDLDRLLEKRYHRELEKIRGMKFDLAFVPLDPRIEGYDLGIRDFLEYASADVVFPMHFGDDFEIIGRFLERIQPEGLPAEIAVIERCGQSFVLKGQGGEHVSL